MTCPACDTRPVEVHFERDGRYYDLCNRCARLWLQRRLRLPEGRPDLTCAREDCSMRVPTQGELCATHGQAMRTGR